MISVSDVKMPENPKPMGVPKIPMYPHGIKPPKMERMINLMRWPEKVHDKLIHEQYGIQVSIIRIIIIDRPPDVVHY